MNSVVNPGTNRPNVVRAGVRRRQRPLIISGFLSNRDSAMTGRTGDHRSNGQPVGENPRIFLPHHLVAFAGAPFETHPIQNRDLPARIPDEAREL